MDAIVTAGGRLKAEDPLFVATGMEKKALIPLAGKPMIGWVLAALRGSGIVNNIVIVGLKPDELDNPAENLHFIDSQGGLIDNLFAGMYKLQELNPQLRKFLVFSSDIPLATPEIVRGFVDECGDQSADMYYAVVEEKTMEARFPHANRTYLPVKGGRYSGGDAFLIDVAAASGNIDLARALVGKRKSPFAQARMAGFVFLLRLLLRRVTINDVAQHAASKAGFDGRAVDTKYAELAMDIDKLNQYEIVKSDLEALSANMA